MKAGTLYKKSLKGRSLRGLRIIESIEVTLRKIKEAVRQKGEQKRFSDVGMSMNVLVHVPTIYTLRG